MPAAPLAHSIVEEMKALEEKHLKEKEELKAPARARLDEIEKLRRELDDEERHLRRILDLEPGIRQRRRTGKRMTALHKKEILGRFITEGHIRHNMKLTKELRTALQDEGLGVHDFRKLNDYMPAGWQAKSNGQRGILAETIFLKNGG